MEKGRFRAHNRGMRKSTSIIIRATIAIGCWLAYDWFGLGGRGMIAGTAIFAALFGAHLLWDEYAHRTHS